jgi:DNA-binding NarL/FixJ family response regulator
MESKNRTPSAEIHRILIVDDHPLVRVGLKSLIEVEADLEICGETGQIGEALDLVRATEPDLAIVDLSLADGNGLELVKRLAAHQEDLRILVCSMHDESLFAQRVLGAGAMGYINKQEATTHILDAVRKLLEGKVWLSKAMTERMLQGFAQGRSSQKTASVESLSDRELEVFGLIGQGMGPSQIAELLHLSVKTIETHKQKIKKKLNLSSSSELTRRAMLWTLEQA